jgi:hypothetical protein
MMMSFFMGFWIGYVWVIWLGFCKLGCPSPDGNGILFLASLARKRYSVQLDKAP